MAVEYEEDKVSQEELMNISRIGKARVYRGLYKPKVRSRVYKYIKAYYEEHKESYKAARDKWVNRLEEEGLNQQRGASQGYFLNQKLKASIAKSKKYPERGRIKQNEIKHLMLAEVKWRAEQYLNKNMEKKKIMCIMGESGVGKTLVSLHLKNHCGANVICSFTTRPPRPDEVEGREHHFIDMAQPKEYMLAHADYGCYSYYALKSQVFGPLTVYVVDQRGVESIREMNGDEFEVFTVFITRDRKLRLRQGVDACRMDRDEGRNTMSLDEYDYVVENNSTKRELFNNIERIYNELINK